MKKVFWVLLTAFILNLSCSGIVSAKEDDHRRVYVLLIDKLSVEDIMMFRPPNITFLIEEGSLGLMNTRTLGPKTTEDGCVTIGAGALARSGPNGLMGFNVEEKYKHELRPAGEVYRGLTGYDPGSHEVVLVNLPEVLAINEQEAVTNTPGILGEVLNRAGLKTCVLGNGDIPGEYRRNAVALAMDTRGAVDFGDVSQVCQVISPRSAGTWETNYPALLGEFHYYRPKADFMVIELSDLARLELGEIALPEVFLGERQRIIQAIDDFVGEITCTMDPNHELLMLVVPSASSLDREAKATLTPLIMYGGHFRKGVLASATTRRDFISANTDLAKTISGFFGLKGIEQSEGQLIENHPYEGNKLDQIASFYQGVAFVNQLRPPLVKGYVGAQIGVLLLTLFIILFSRRYIGIAKPLVFSLACVPLVFLLVPVLPIRSPAVYIILNLVALAALVVIIYRLCHKLGLSLFLVVALLTTMLLDIDVLTGAHLIKGSVLGYDPASGARYYGIGNEYMGVLIGTTLLTGSIIYQQWKSRLTLVAVGLGFAFQVFLLASPNLGANAGGTIAATFAFILSLFLLSEWRLRFKTVVGIGVTVGLLILALAVFDMNRPPELQSHIGRAANMVAAGGWQEVYNIVSRKLAMNVKLIRYTIWSRVFLVSLVTLAILLYRPHGVIKAIGEKHPYVLRGLIGIVTGAFVALVFNDSGIVAAATMTIFAASPLSYLALVEVEGG